MNNVVNCPVRDKILVEKYRHPYTECPDRDKIKYCVPDGTFEYSDMSDFYQYKIPSWISTQYLSATKIIKVLTYLLLLFAVISCGQSTTGKLKKSEIKGNNKIRQTVISEAKKHLGKPYQYAGKGPKNFDCSGFTKFVYAKAAKIELPPNSAMQANVGKKIAEKEAKVGDLIFFGDPITKKINHVGIITNISKNAVTGMIHSSSTRGVVIDNDNESWNNHWKKRIVKVVNVIDK